MRSTEAPGLEPKRPGSAPSSGRFSGLDGLRALAVVAVLLFHADAGLLPGGFLGVDLFFAISGYLITRLLLGELRRTGGLDLAGFYLRRAFRLLPAVVVMLVVIVLGSVTVWRDELPNVRGELLSTLSYSSNWWLIDAHHSYFVASGRPPMTQQLWSLAIEEQFYLIWPLFLLLSTAGLYRVGRRIGRLRGPAYPQRWPLPARFGGLALLCLALAGASTAAMAVQAVRSDVPFGGDSSRVYFGTDTHAMGLLFGAMFGALAERQRLAPKRWRVRRWVSDLGGLVALAALVGAVLRIDEFSPGLYRGGFGLISLLAAATVAAVARDGSRLGRCLDVRPLRWVAERSYAIYLWHWPVVVVTRPDVDLTADHRLVLVLRLVAPVLLAEVSYRLVERPVRRLGARYLSRRDASETVVSVPPARPRILAPRWLAVLGLVGLFAALMALPDGRPTDPLQPVAATVSIDVTSTPSPAATDSRRPTVRRAVPKKLVPVKKPAAVKAPAVKVQSRPVISAYGDSVMLGAQSALGAAFGGCDLHAVEGRQPYVTLAEVRADHDAGRQQRIVVIHTGNNGVIRPSDLSDTLAALKDRSRVVLVTDRVPMDWQSPNNATIAGVAKRFRNVVLVDWYARSNGSRDWFYADGLHLRPDGAAQYSQLLLAAVR